MEKTHSSCKTTWLVTRHSGAVSWARRQGIHFDRHVENLDASQVHAGDIVIGTLPMHVASDICSRGAEFWALSLTIGQNDMGRELSSEELARRGASLKRFIITEIAEPFPRFAQTP